MSTYNNNLRFYQRYYKGIDWSKKTDDKDNAERFASRNKELTDSILPVHEDGFPFGYAFPKDHCIELETTYPGLLLGSGITHGSGLLGEIKLGFFLDHTTGLPVIPGSSVKGVLRSVFPLGFKHIAAKEKDSDNKAVLLGKAESVTKYIQALLHKIAPNQDWDTHAIEEFEVWLFGSYEPGVKVGDMSGRTIFHDAVPVSAAQVKVRGINTGQYLATDFITPHKNRKTNNIPDALVNPTPIGFLKVLPGVVFRFQFRFTNYLKNGHELGIEAIRRLIESILTDMGIGAKTNVGYGRLQKPGQKPKQPPRKATEGRKAGRQATGKPEPEPKTQTIEPIKLEKVKRGAEVSGEVVDNKGGSITFKLDVIGYEEPVSVSYRASHLFETGAKYKLKIKQIQRVGPKRKLFIDFPSPKDKID